MGWLYFFLGVLASVLIGFLYYKLGNKEGKPSYQHTTALIFDISSNYLEKLYVTYDNKEVKRLYRTNVFVWNQGKTAILKKQLVKRNPLRIQLLNQDKSNLDEDLIIDARIIGSSRPKAGNNFKIKTSPKIPSEIIITFDYANQNDGIIIEITHSVKKAKVKVIGSLIDIPKGINDYGEYTSKNRINKEFQKFRKQLPNIVLSYLLVFSVFIASKVSPRISVDVITPAVHAILVSIFNAFFAITSVLTIVLLVIITFLRAYRFNACPKELEKVFEKEYE